MEGSSKLPPKSQVRIKIEPIAQHDTFQLITGLLSSSKRRIGRIREQEVLVMEEVWMVPSRER